MSFNAGTYFCCQSTAYFCGAPARNRVQFTRVLVCPGTDARVTFVRVRTDVRVAICPCEICLGKELFGVFHMLG